MSSVGFVPLIHTIYLINHLKNQSIVSYVSSITYVRHPISRYVSFFNNVYKVRYGFRSVFQCDAYVHMHEFQIRFVIHQRIFCHIHN